MPHTASSIAVLLCSLAPAAGFSVPVASQSLEERLRSKVQPELERLAYLWNSSLTTRWTFVSWESVGLIAPKAWKPCLLTLRLTKSFLAYRALTCVAYPSPVPGLKVTSEVVLLTGHDQLVDLVLVTNNLFRDTEGGNLCV